MREEERTRTTELLISKINVERAFTTGDTPERIIANIYKESVCVVDPAQKNEIRKSSNEMMNTRRLAAKIAGNKNGRTI